MLYYKGDWVYYDEELDCLCAWYVKPCLEWLKSLDLKGKSVFEYGVGNSTKWWKRAVGENGIVFGVDSNEKWAGEFGAFLTQDEKEYTSHILDTNTKFDFIIIDGIYRDECTEYALQAIKPGGYIIIDNYNQSTCGYQPPFWDKTEGLLEGYPRVIYKQEEVGASHPDWQTLVVQISK